MRSVVEAKVGSNFFTVAFFGQTTVALPNGNLITKLDMICVYLKFVFVSRK